ncbi:DUF6436 domain-containing protein [Pokkaliibacter sp. CJK22405]|uniref:DUF6436 domain-containing protein n=1 Tax=Pokkaliibacter sp. CJK22405 TaxID=3384615 RepID=UPI003984CF08
MTQRTVLSVSILVVWVIAMATAFWWFQWRNLRSFDTSESWRFYPETLPAELQPLLARLPKDAAKGYLLHFWTPNCACNVGNLEHLARLGARFSAEGIQLVVIGHPDEELPKLWRRVEKTWDGHIGILSAPLKPVIPGTPAALVLDAHQQPIYFGPYSSSADCSVADEGLIEYPLQSVVDAMPVRPQSYLSFGCFCDQPEFSSARPADVVYQPVLRGTL